MGTTALGNFSTADLPDRTRLSPTAALLFGHGHRGQLAGSFVGDQIKEASNSISMITDEGGGNWVKWTRHSSIANESALDV